MKFYSFLVMVCMVLLSTGVQAQYNIPENSVWKFGGGAGFNFNSNTANTSMINANESTSAIADANGNLRFYTDGNRIWDANNNPMPSANPIFPAPLVNVTQSTVQGALIVPFPNNSNKYYLFSLSAQELANNEGGKLYYSIVDMTLNNGLGDIVPGAAHILIDTGFSEHMIAVPSCGAIWIVLHGRTSPTFKSYRIDENGINLNPIISQTGVQGFVGPGNSSNPGFLGNNFYIVGQLAVSPDYKQLAAAYFRGNLVELYSFNNNTGEVLAKGIVDSSNDYYGFYGVSFSPDSKKLYASNCAATTYLKAFNQYNLALPTISQIRASKVFLGPCNTSLTQLQLASNGKIYFNGGYISKLGSIENPNVLGTGSGLNLQSTNLLSGTNVNAALQNTIMKVLLLTEDTFSIAWKDTLVCEGDVISITARTGGSSYEWSDGQLGAQKQITTPGTYWVSYIKNCAVYIDTLKVRLRVGGVDLGADTAVCGSYVLVPQFTGVPNAIEWSNGSTASTYRVDNTGAVSIKATIGACTYRDTIYVNQITLYANLGDDTSYCKGEQIRVTYEVNPPPNTSITWSNGSTNNKITVIEPGTYEVTLSHPTCGVFTDQVNITELICDCEVRIPTAFTPNNDGKNDQFGIVIEEGCLVRGFIMRIYNRWGQLVFESFNSNNTWDGTFNGNMVDVGVYFYQIQFEKGTNATKVKQSGDITLLR